MFSRLISNIKDYYQGIGAGAILTGAIDVIVVRQPDGTFKSTPFHVCFGKLGILRPSEMTVDITVNNEFVTHLEMRLGPTGEAYFPIGEEGEVLVSEEHVTQHQANKPFPNPPNQDPLHTVLPVSDEEDNVFQMDCESRGLDRSVTPTGSSGVGTGSQSSTYLTRGTNFWDEDSLSPNSRGLSSSWNVVPPTQATLSQGEQTIIRTERHRNLTESSVQGFLMSEPRPVDTDQRHKRLSTSYYPCSDAEQGKYLSEVVGALEKDPTLTNLYLYTQTSPDPHVDNDTNKVKAMRSLPVEGDDSVQEFLLSLCGGLDGKHEPSFERFLQHLISGEEFARDPRSVLAHQDLVVRWNGRYYTWPGVSAMIVSLLAFQVPIEPSQLAKLNVHKSGRSPQPPSSTSSTSRTGGFRSWLWGSAVSTIKTPVDLEVNGDVNTSNSAPSSAPLSPNAPLSTSLPKSPLDAMVDVSGVSSSGGTVGAWRSEDDLCTKSKSPQVYPHRSTSDTKETSPIPVRRRSKCLSSDMIAKLNLVEGANEVIFSVTTRFQGTCRCSCYIYLWNWDDRVVVSDIDGTITKSDVLGNIFSLVGPYWAQSGIAELYQRLSKNDYKLIYLSARAMGQSAVTRNYLRALRQDGMALPDGPLLLAPMSLFMAFHKEVIERRPEEFKIACLTEVKSLFPVEQKPLYAGFGNRPNDVVTYKAVGVDLARIFTVNPLGQLRHELTGHKTVLSYSSLHAIADLYFPPVQHLRGGTCGSFNDFMYWGYMHTTHQDHLQQVLASLAKH